MFEHSSQLQKKGPQSPVDVQKGVDMIISNLNEGKPVMAGVDHDRDAKSDNDNLATDHFVVIVGIGKDKNGYYVSYVDNAASGGEKTGTDTEQNIMYYDEKTNTFIDKKAPYKDKVYILSEVRPTHRKEEPNYIYKMIP